MSVLPVNVKIEGNLRIDYHPREIKAALLQGARLIRTDTKRNLARRGISKPDEFPGKTTGDLQKSIIAKASKSGYSAKVEAKRTERMARRKFYPTILVRGTRNKRIKARKDPVIEAYESQKNDIRGMIADALQKAINPKR